MNSLPSLPISIDSYANLIILIYNRGKCVHFSLIGTFLLAGCYFTVPLITKM